MSSTKKTLPEWHAFLEEQFHKVPRESIRFLSLEALPRLMFLLDNQRHFCENCATRFDRLLSMSVQFSEWVKSDAPELQLFRKELQNTTRYLSAQHGFYPKGLWLSKFTTAGIVIGIAIAFFAYSLSESLLLPGILILGAAVGMSVGWLLGKWKEAQLKRDHKLY